MFGRRQYPRRNGTSVVFVVAQYDPAFAAIEPVYNFGQSVISRRTEKGVRFGRPPMPLPKEFPRAFLLWTEGKITLADAARQCHMAESSFRYRAILKLKSR